MGREHVEQLAQSYTGGPHQWFGGRRAAEILVRVAKHREIPDYLPLGVNAVEGSIRLDGQLLAAELRWSDASRSARLRRALPGKTPQLTGRSRAVISPLGPQGVAPSARTLRMSIQKNN